MKMKKKWGVTFDIRKIFYFHFDDPKIAFFSMADEYMDTPSGPAFPHTQNPAADEFNYSRLVK